MAPGVALLHTGDARGATAGIQRFEFAGPTTLRPNPVPDKDTSRALLVIFTLGSNQFLPNTEARTHDVERLPGGHDGP